MHVARVHLRLSDATYAAFAHRLMYFPWCVAQVFTKYFYVHSHIAKLFFNDALHKFSYAKCVTDLLTSLCTRRYGMGRQGEASASVIAVQACSYR